MGDPSGQRFLSSTNISEIWHPGRTMVAEHANTWSSVRHSEPAPLERCGCGIYAVARGEDLDFQPRTGRRLGSGAAWGIVKLWGKVIKHAKGYRAQYAEIVALLGELESGSSLLNIEQIAGLYGIPVITEEEWYGGSPQPLDRTT